MYLVCGVVPPVFGGGKGGGTAWPISGSVSGHLPDLSGVCMCSNPVSGSALAARFRQRRCEGVGVSGNGVAERACAGGGGAWGMNV